jgi:hypothetical protein
MKPTENDIEEKTSLWDTLIVLREKQFQWILPYFWSEDDNGPSYFGYGLAYLCKEAGVTKLRECLTSPPFILVANTIRESQELGGHPVLWKSLFTLWLFAIGREYDIILNDAKEYELLELNESDIPITQTEQIKAINRAKQRVQWARNRMEKMGYPVRYLNKDQLVFYRLIQKAERELNSELNL